MSKHIIAPSLLAADFTKLGEEVKMVNESTADWFHVDVMDGNFVPNISFGFFIIEQIKKIATKPLDVHLMITQPEQYIERFRAAGADIITVHYEACPHIHRTIQQIKATGAKAGVAINPGTPVSVLEDLLEDIDLALIMSVNPGFGGQKFIYQSLSRIKRLSEMIKNTNSSAIIEVDGGVGMQNIEVLLRAGATALVAGNSVFSAPNPTEAIKEMKEININEFWV